MSATWRAENERPAYDDCRGGWGFWWIPAAVLGILAAIGIGLAVAVGLGWVSSPPWGGPFPFFWPVFPLGFFLVVFLVFFALRWNVWGHRRWGYGGFGWHDGPGAREIVRQRYARGEISREELERMSRDLDQVR